MHQAQGDQGNGQRVQAHQHRYGHGNQLCQTLIGDNCAEHRNADDHEAVGNARQLAEEAAASCNQAHARGQAGQHDDDGQQPQPGWAKSVLHKGREKLHAGGGVGGQIAAGCAQIDQ